MCDFKLEHTPQRVYFVLYALSDAAQEWLNEYRQQAESHRTHEFSPMTGFETIITPVLSVPREEKDSVVEKIEQAGLTVDTSHDSECSGEHVRPNLPSGTATQQVFRMTREGFLQPLIDNTRPDALPNRESKGRAKRPESSTDPVMTLASLKRKLHPNQFVGLSELMAGIVGCVLGEKFTLWSFTSLSITHGGHVVAMPDGSPEYSVWLGTFTKLGTDWTQLLEAAELTIEECALANRLFARALLPPHLVAALTESKLLAKNRPEPNLTEEDRSLLRELHIRW